MISINDFQIKITHKIEGPPMYIRLTDWQNVEDESNLSIIFKVLYLKMFAKLQLFL